MPMKASLPIAMSLAALTQRQSSIVLACLVFVVVLLVFGYIKSMKRLSELEEVVFKNRDRTKEVLKSGRENLDESR